MGLDGGYIGSWHHAQAEHYDGMLTGFRKGEQVGYDNGYADGKADGYREGYKIGWQEHAVAVQPRIDKLNAAYDAANAEIRKANAIIPERNAKIAELQQANAALTAELAALKAQQQSMLQAQQQAAAMQAALRKANEQLQQQLQQTADERDAKHALAVERAYRNNRLAVAMAAAHDTLREATEAKCEPARRIAHIFSTNFKRNESEALAKRMILSPLVDDPAFSEEAPRTMQLINDMAFIQRVDPPNRIPMDNEHLYEE